MSKHPQRLIELESILSANEVDFYALGKALMEIKDHRLFIPNFKSFEVYVKEKWDISRAQAYRFISAAQVIENLSPIGDILPKNEAQARPLTPFDVSDQKNVWQHFVKSKLPQNSTNIHHFIKEFFNLPEKKGAGNVFIASSNYELAIKSLLEQISIAKNDHWTSTSRAAAIHWNNVMRTLIQQKD